MRDLVVPQKPLEEPRLIVPLKHARAVEQDRRGLGGREEPPMASGGEQLVEGAGNPAERKCDGGDGDSETVAGCDEN